ncbi:MAG: NAD(P)/FAD-dependent oxidoreductase [Proteobacteria bacterium]|nr:NAD(P)/FAD-dependent oxidoreductase [Pseudomonadota bacterium]
MARTSSSGSSRRDVLKLAGLATAAGFGVRPAFSQSPGHVVVVGGGFGGATAAKYLRRAGVDVTLIETNATFATCPFSNTVLGGINEIDAITHGYDGLAAHGVQVVPDTVTGINAANKSVSLQGGTAVSYDRLILSPGIDFKWGEIEGYDEAAAEVMPHAWKAGAQTELLRRQLIAMDDGGVVAIAAPGNPFRCPPGPYERASLIAHYLKTHKPASKVLILDSKDSFSKQGLFQAGWAELYGDMIEWVPFSSGGNVARVDPATMTVYTDFDTHVVNVANIIPAQRSNRLVDTADLANGGDWCPINQLTFESTVQPGIHILGDASIAGAMPKSGFSANAQAKVCAAAIAALLRGDEPPSPSFINTCYSLVGPDYGISVAAVYRLNAEGAIAGVEGAGGVSPGDANAEFRKMEAEYARGWYASITSDMFG